MVHYGMSKTAQLAVARGLAESFPASGVTVNSVLAGPTDSGAFGEFLDSMAKQEGMSWKAIADGFFANACPSSLLKRVATTDEVASMVTYLCSEAASATSGSSLRVDGGVVRSIAGAPMSVCRKTISAAVGSMIATARASTRRGRLFAATRVRGRCRRARSTPARLRISSGRW
jgi:short-subunit dehydrogenase